MAQILSGFEQDLTIEQIFLYATEEYNDDQMIKNSMGTHALDFTLEQININDCKKRLDDI